ETAENLMVSHRDSLSGSARPGPTCGASSCSAKSATSSKKEPATINDTGVTRNARPTRSPTPLKNDNTAAAHGCASAALATISLWSTVQKRASKAKVSASVFQNTRRKGGVKIWLAAKSAASSITSPATFSG